MLLQSIVQYFAFLVDIVEFQWILMVSILAVCVVVLLAGAIWDPDFSKWMRYKDLINHPDPIIRQTWMESGEDKFGQLFQGFGGVEGKHVLELIHKSKIPGGYEATYARYTAARKPKKEKPNQC
jgi:hypothetical protein